MPNLMFNFYKAQNKTFKSSVEFKILKRDSHNRIHMLMYLPTQSLIIPK